MFWSTQAQDKPKEHCSIYFKNKSILKCDVKMVYYSGWVSKGDSRRDNLEHIRHTLHFSCTVVSIQALSVSQCDRRQKNTKYIYQGKFNRHNSTIWTHKVTFPAWAANMDIREGTVFQSINTNKSKPFLKLKGAVDSQKKSSVFTTVTKAIWAFKKKH